MPFIAFTDGRNRQATDSVESDCHTARCGAVRLNFDGAAQGSEPHCAAIQKSWAAPRREPCPWTAAHRSATHRWWHTHICVCNNISSIRTRCRREAQGWDFASATLIFVWYMNGIQKLTYNHGFCESETIFLCYFRFYDAPRHGAVRAYLGPHRTAPHRSKAQKSWTAPRRTAPCDSLSRMYWVLASLARIGHYSRRLFSVDDRWIDYSWWMMGRWSSDGGDVVFLVGRFCVLFTCIRWFESCSIFYSNQIRV